MIDDMDLLDEIYFALKTNDRFCELVGRPKTTQLWEEKIRREICPDDEVSASKLNFISIYLSSATETDNVYVSRGFLNVDYYCKSRIECREMKRIVKSVLEDMGMFCTSMYNTASGIKGVYKYTQKYRPLVWA